MGARFRADVEEVRIGWVRTSAQVSGGARRVGARFRAGVEWACIGWVRVSVEAHGSLPRVGARVRAFLGGSDG